MEALQMTRISIHVRLRRVARIVLILVAATACGSARRTPGEPPARLIFTNESLDQATVYVVAPGMDFRRVGVVIPGRTDTLDVPPGFATRGTINIVARLLARTELPQTGPVSRRPGEHYLVRLHVDARVLSFLPAEP
jgi:hypothetical protein